MVEVAALVQMGLVGEALDHGPVAVFVFDDQGRYAAVNQFACDLLGYSREELLALRLGALATSPEAMADYVAVATGALPEGRVRVRRRDGRHLWLRFRGRESRVAGMTFYVGVAWPEPR